MKYLLFSGRCYYASGGARDIVKSGANLDDLIIFANAEQERRNDEHFEWWHIMDLETLCIVAKSEDEPCG